jgi:ketosteroid isomerase-like protein
MIGTRGSMVASLLLLATGCGAQPAPCVASAAAPADNAADVLALREIEVVFHDAGSKKDLERMMSLFADDAVLTVGDKTFTGKDQVRHYFADIAAPFRPENDMIAYTPAQRIRTAIQGDTATLYFECLWLDTKGPKAPLHTFSDDTLARSGSKWIIKKMKAGLVSGL